ncbi:MAG: hypothetical protein A3I61_03620 [Acidobacteria bacterium RIFCSPLOWO2_02_FULL_68_18]|nr:MAG: hypothetical protein A3I61_03620 [Acidobacteria bacterium RIFCSPLOWO2_02_FULL_68_18]OFW51616.1 MAG: hypothetical protein A3G77_08010 [Acidobacteria bacterium RIFCSPLOWO2_12_FULL_68_19]
MSVFVIDASVVIKWFIPEVRSEAARRWLEFPHDYFAPDLVFAEVGNAMWKKVRRGELTRQEALRLARDVPAAAVEAIPMRGLLPDAEALALSAGVTVYDAMYVALAVRLETHAVTADDRLLRIARRHSAVSNHVRSVEDFPE